MLRLEIYRRSVSERKPVATIIVKDDELRVVGDLDIIDFGELVTRESDRRVVGIGDDLDAWVRGLESSYNTGGQGQTFARLVER